MVTVNWAVKAVLTGGVLMTAAGCGGPSRAERAMAEKDERIARQDKDLAVERNHSSTAMQHATAAQQQNELLAKQNEDLIKKNGMATMEASAKIDTLAAQIKNLEGKLGSKGSSDMSVGQSSKEPGAIVITVAGTTLFDSGSATLKESSFATLKKVADTIKTQYPNNFVRVEGHTDSTPVVRNKDKFSDNMQLSQARAKAVFDQLTEKCGMAANKMYTAGYAYNQPVVWPEKTAADRGKNRRVDIVILPMVKVEKNSLVSNSK